MKNLALYAALAALTLGATVASAKDPINTKAALGALTKTPVVELPAAATKIVTSVPRGEQAALVGSVVRKVARTHPAALRHVVAAISKAHPTLASIAAAAAVRAHPEATLAITSAACSAAPEKAAEILAICSRVAVASPTVLAEVVAEANPVFSVDALVRESTAMDVTVDAAVVTGGNVITPIIPPGSIGQDLNFEEVLVAPSPVGPGQPGFDPDRYAAAGR
jgi:hypothetical protein